MTPSLGVGVREKTDMYKETKKKTEVHISLHIFSSTVHFVLFHDCDNFSKKQEHQSNKCQRKFLFINYLRIPRFMHLWFPQPNFSHTILISHNTVWSRGIFKVNRESLLHFPSKPRTWNTFLLLLEIHALLVCLMWRQFIIPVWHATIFKKDFAFSFIKIAFQVLHHNIYFSLLLYFQFWYILLLTQKQSLKEGNCNILGLACKASTRRIKMNLRRPRALIRTLYKIVSYCSQTKIKPLPIQTIPHCKYQQATNSLPPPFCWYSLAE